MIDVPLDLLEFYTFVDEWLHLCRQEFVESRVIQCQDQASETPARHKSEELLEKEFIVRMPVVVDSLG